MIFTELIKKLRDETGAGMSDIKKALDEAGGDEAKAVEILRKSGQKIAAKKAERATNEGVIAFARSDDKVAVVSLACETDFVALNENFITTAQNLADKLLTIGQNDFMAAAEQEIQNDLIVKIGENIKLVEAEIINGSGLGVYLHANNKILAIVGLQNNNDELARGVAMHVAAMNPAYLEPADVPAEVLDKEKEIYAEQLKQENKPAEMMEKILAGKIQKFYTEVCLLKQPFIKDDKQTVEQFLKGAKVTQFKRFSL